MEEQKPYVFSVRQMVEFICRRGDLTGGFGGSVQRALEGTRVHQKLQKSRSGAYQSEVALKTREILSDGLILQVEGKMCIRDRRSRRRRPRRCAERFS